MKSLFKSLLLCLTLILFCGKSIAQSEIRTPLGEVYYDSNLYKAKYEYPEGSPYLTEKFLPARINELSETQLVRFNAFEGLVEVGVSGNEVVVLDESTTYIILLLDGSGRIYHTFHYLDEKKEKKHSFFELVEENQDYVLYVRERKKYYKKEKAQGYSDAKPARFTETNPVFYINDVWKNSGNLVELPDRLNGFLQMFPGHEKAMKTLAKKEKLKPDNKEDLIQLLNFYFEQK